MILLGACTSGDGPAASAKGEKRVRHTAPLPRAQLKKLLLSRIDLSGDLKEEYRQVWPTTTSGKSLKASKPECQPLADAIRPWSADRAGARASRRFVKTPEDFVSVVLVSYPSVKDASAVMSKLRSSPAACTSPFRAGETSKDSDPYQGVKRKAAPKEGDEALSYYLRVISYAKDRHESPELFVHVRVGNLVVTFSRYGSYRPGDNTIPPNLIKAQVDKIETT
ncbi:sensor domain-containing protein [Streptomyces oryzae]|uniref:Sensor domain-containing protein n=1 Tax=Streptomyces oryzae TaxID=1434886 RepID=A0ABS3XJ27_9ACTN|nr:sensor domain-containing protein [Streptomyces oryzae]MBO8195410.1 sensor domain-containing protein [Streptomyces oryzae]